MNIKRIKLLCQSDRLRWTIHIISRLIQRNISIADVKSAILHGKIIEEYPHDYPYPSCLILGITLQNEYLHIVCGVANDELWLITAYRPSTTEWDSSFTHRKEQQK